MIDIVTLAARDYLLVERYTSPEGARRVPRALLGALSLSAWRRLSPAERAVHLRDEIIRQRAERERLRCERAERPVLSMLKPHSAALVPEAPREPRPRTALVFDLDARDLAALGVRSVVPCCSGCGRFVEARSSRPVKAWCDDECRPRPRRRLAPRPDSA